MKACARGKWCADDRVVGRLPLSRIYFLIYSLSLSFSFCHSPSPAVLVWCIWCIVACLSVCVSVGWLTSRVEFLQIENGRGGGSGSGGGAAVAQQKSSSSAQRVVQLRSAIGSGVQQLLLLLLNHTENVGSGVQTTAARAAAAVAACTADHHLRWSGNTTVLKNRQ